MWVLLDACFMRGCPIAVRFLKAKVVQAGWQRSLTWPGRSISICGRSLATAVHGNGLGSRARLERAGGAAEMTGVVVIDAFYEQLHGCG
jgi:hypothetical protein